MPPVSLLFSSEEETSRPLLQALRELELEVESCPDIFAAVEWLTSRSFDVIVADWDGGPEAAFLLKNARELKLNNTAFTLAVTRQTGNPAAGENSPDLVLAKPLTPDQIKYALLTNDRFLGCMKGWIARGDFPLSEKIPSVGTSESRQPQLKQPSPTPLSVCAPEPSPIPARFYGKTSPPLNLTFASLDRSLFRSLNQSRNQHVSPPRKSVRNRFLWGSALGVALVSAGYIFGQPLQVQSVFASMATAYKQVQTRLIGEPPEAAPIQDSIATAQAAKSQGPRSRRYPFLRFHQVPVYTTNSPDEILASPAETLQADAHLDHGHLPGGASGLQIPESLQRPQPESAAVRATNPRRSLSLLSQVEPVNLTETLSEGLLVDRVQPSYPEQALKAGLQGVVVLQAWIGKDGSIRDLKLVDGSLLLGQAAVKAVRQWRYKPYLRNGVAVDAETFITVNFKLP